MKASKLISVCVRNEYYLIVEMCDFHGIRKSKNNTIYQAFEIYILRFSCIIILKEQNAIVEMHLVKVLG